ncbi:hypothetical protein V2G26_013833 [Clonostachys chloroleuca]
MAFGVSHPDTLSRCETHPGGQLRTKRPHRDFTFYVSLAEKAGNAACALRRPLRLRSKLQRVSRNQAQETCIASPSWNDPLADETGFSNIIQPKKEPLQ